MPSPQVFGEVALLSSGESRAGGTWLGDDWPRPLPPPYPPTAGHAETAPRGVKAQLRFNVAHHPCSRHLGGLLANSGSSYLLWFGACWAGVGVEGPSGKPEAHFTETWHSRSLAGVSNRVDFPFRFFPSLSRAPGASGWLSLIPPPSHVHGTPAMGQARLSLSYSLSSTPCFPDTLRPTSPWPFPAGLPRGPEGLPAIEAVGEPRVWGEGCSHECPLCASVCSTETPAHGPRWEWCQNPGSFLEAACSAGLGPERLTGGRAV